MNKIKLIIFREYWTRVKSKSFILITLLVPLSVFLFIGVTGLIGSYKSDAKKSFVIVDPNHILDDSFEVKNINFKQSSVGLSEALKSFDKEKYTGLIYFSPLDSLSNQVALALYSDKTIPINISSKIKRNIKAEVKKHKLNQLHLSPEALSSLNVQVEMDQEGIEVKDTKKSAFLSGAALAIGGLMGMLMYFFIFFYGVMVMKSVVEEKTNRIIEVIISSVSPTELMMGKILGVGLVALTQIVIWMAMMTLIQVGMTMVFGASLDVQDISTLPKGGAGNIMEILETIGSINWLLILPMFVLYFFGGYLLYAALFAAVGSAVGDATGDNQTMTLPIAIPIMIGMFLMMQAVKAPDSSLALTSSIIPLFSPLVMPSLLPFEPPIWQLVLSLVVLYGSAYFFIWLAGRIYRVGILLYGKKIKAFEMMKWIFKREI